MLGAVVVLGWSFDLPALRSVLRGAVEMKANTAAALLLAGAALFILGGPLNARRRRIASACAAVVVAVGLATALEYAAGWNLRIDEILFTDTGKAFNAIPGRMSPYSAVAFAGIGLALLGAPHRRLRPLVWLLSTLVGLIGLVSLLGYVWNASELVTDSVLPPVAVHTGLAFALLGVGTLRASQPRLTGGAPRLATIELKVAAGLIGAFVLLVAAGGMAYESSALAAESARSVVRTQEVRTALRQLYAALSDAESEARAYALTGNRRHRDGFAGLAATVPTTIESLSRLIGDLEQRRFLSRVQELSGRHLDGLRRAVEALDATRRQRGVELLFTAEQYRVIAELREAVDRLEESEARLLAARESTAARDRQKALLFLIFALVWAAGIFVYLSQSLRREMLGRALGEQRIGRLNADLERRVEERTASLEENQRRFAQLIEFAPDGLVMVDREGRMLQVNRQVETMFGVPREQLLGGDIAALVAEVGDGAAQLRAGLGRQANAASEASEHIELRGRRHDATTFPLSISLRPLDVDGERRIVLALRDSSERERLDRALHDSFELHRHTLDHMLEGCQVIGFDWRYRYVNAAAAAQMRRSADSLIGKTMDEAYPDVQSTQLFAAFRRCMEERTAQSCDGEYAFGDGTRGWFELSVLPSPEGISVFSVDVSERKRAEAEIHAINADLERRVAERTVELTHAREAAEGANRAKSAFLATMSHEIRTPMNGVVGMLDVLAQSGLSERQADAVGTMRSSAFSLLAIIDDVLDFSKIEAGRLELEHAPVALADLCESVCNTLLPVAMDKDVELDLFIDPRLPAQLFCDSTRVRQVLFNLLGNAIKFSAGTPNRRGRVSVRAEALQAAPARLVLCVADNGIGMSRDTLDRLFTSFTQAETSTTRRFGGTGLGLAICKRLVELMGGDIDVTSALGVGTTFVATLPLEAVPHAVGPPLADVGGLDCLLVKGVGEIDSVAAYLEHGGALVRRVGTLNAALTEARRSDRAVVVEFAGRGAAVVTPQVSADGAAIARRVRIERGRRAGGGDASGDTVVVVNGNVLRRSAVLRAVAVAAGRASPEIVYAGEIGAGMRPRVIAPTIAKARERGRLILIAEDDEVNQKVILRQLELLGHAAEVAHDGAEALRLWRAGNYALLFTDLHMPGMDGYALAAAIRSEEAARGAADQPRLPIVALTANALRGEVTRAVGAGMDDYLTKPLQLQVLAAALGRWLPFDADADADRDAGTSDRGATATLRKDDTSAAVDVGVLESLVGSDAAVVREFLGDYVASARRLAEELRAARGDDDLRRMGAIAHKLKSSSRSVGAMVLGDVCSAIENDCRTGSRESVLRGLTDFEAALREAEGQIDRLLASTH